MVFLWRAVVVLASVGGGTAAMYFFDGRWFALIGLVLFTALVWFAEGRLVERKVDDTIRERLDARHRRRMGEPNA